MSLPTGQVSDRVAQGDRGAVVELLDRHRIRLRRRETLWLHPRSRGRGDALDVIQEGYLEAPRRVGEFNADRSVSFYTWLRFLVGQWVLEQHRRHLGTTRREVSMYRGDMPGADTVALAARLLDELTSPSQAAPRAGRKLQLQEAFDRKDPLDRKILVPRHYAQMTNAAVAALGLDRSVSSRRYTWALVRLNEVLAGLPGATSGEQS